TISRALFARFTVKSVHMKSSPDGVIRFNITKLDELCDEAECSPDVDVHGITWWAEAVDDGSLNVRFSCLVEQEEPWFFLVDSEFTLFNSDTSKNVVIERSDIFSNGHTYYEYEKGDHLVWESIIDEQKGFVKEGKLDVQICFWINKQKGVRMTPLRIIEQNNNAGKKTSPSDGVIRFEVSEVSELDQDGRYSPEIVVGGVPWNVNVCRSGDLYAYLFCTHEQKTSSTIDVDVEFVLVNEDNSNNAIVETADTFYNQQGYSDHIGATFLEWNELINENKGFMQDDKVIVEVRIWINGMKGIRIPPRVDFTDSNYTLHDVTLLVQGEKVYASKTILSINSSYFEKMFNSDFAEKNKQEIELKDVDRAEFIELLNVIYPSNKKITDASAEYLLHLADRFLITSVIERAEEALLHSRVISNREKLAIADRYNLFALQEHCLSTLKSTEDFKSIKESPIYSSLSGDMKTILFERLLEIAK
ncbi:hypothetical protein PMAYCL1PPCAC_24879, partial [Pristionchus mayeri]